MHVLTFLVQQRYPADVKFPAVSKAISQVELALQAAGAKVRAIDMSINPVTHTT